VSTRPARHRRPDPADEAVSRLLARLGPTHDDAAGGWVPQRPQPADRGGTRLPLVRPRARWAPTRRAVVGVATVLLVAVLVAVLLVWRAQPSAEAAPVVLRDATPSAVPAAVTPSADGTGAPAEVVVHVVGAVRRPGLVTLPAGSRVADAVAAAGGAAVGARKASVNLARVLVDGEQIAVQSRAGPPVAAAPGAVAGPAGAPAAAPVDLNTATLEALDGLPGIGPVLAQRILDWRTAHGRFSSVDELSEVSGIGTATLADLRPAVTV
jgi:competence protein ComEA